MGAAWRIRGFELDRRLGSGASSEVWRARVVSSGDSVALKRLVLSGPEQGRRAVTEAAKLRVLDHPHLVRLHDLVLHRDAAVLVLDLADAGSLADLLTVRGRVTPGEAITAIAPVAAALAHVHAAGIVHGDVSPANILFTRGGLPLLADLGVARLTGDATDAESTPAYVDPLVARGGVPTAHSDVFMLGAVALHALTGAPLWTAHTGDAALAQACSGGLGHVEGRLAVAGLPTAMAAVIRRALTLEPHRRGTAADFALDLRHSGEPVAVELAAGRTRVAERSAAADHPEPEPPRSPRSRGVVVGHADPRSEHPVPPPASLTRPRRVPARLPSVVTGADTADDNVDDNADDEADGGAGGGADDGAGGGAEGAVDGADDPTVRAVPRSGPGSGLPARAGGPRHAAVPVKRVRRAGDAEPNPVERVRRVIAGRSREVPAPTGNVTSPASASVDPLLPDLATGSRHVAADPARPAFARPNTTGALRGPLPDAEVVVGRPAPTRAVARARPGLPPAGRRPPARALVVGAGLVVLVAVGLVTVLVGRGHPSAVAAAVRVSAHAATSSTAAAPTTGTVPSTSPTGSTAPTAATGAVRNWPATLRALDATRSRAYATRDGSLLGQVYVAGRLRSADAASILRLVPPGCGLMGVRTVFRAVRVRPAPPARHRVVLTARASLPASRLVCPDRSPRTVPSVGPTRLAITLVAHGRTALIADEEVLA